MSRELKLIAEIREPVCPPGVVKHWQLYYRGEFIADTSVPEMRELWKELCWRVNRV